MQERIIVDCKSFAGKMTVLGSRAATHSILNLFYFLIINLHKKVSVK
jgi:hypothetical protein